MITFAFIVGLWFALAVFIPRLRWRWAGTRIDCGPVGSLGVSMIFFSWGLRRIYADSLSGFAYGLLVSASIAGWIIAIAGLVIIRRRAKRTGSMMQDLQKHMITRV